MSAKAQPQVPSLDERIAAAFVKGMKSGDVADLIAEAEAVAILAADAAEAARTRALDPVLTAADVAAARRAMEDAAFSRDRMQVAVQRLGERLVEVKREEEQARRRVAYEAAVAERDKLAAQLAQVYPALAEKLADLAARIAASDAVIDRVNRKPPDGTTWIAGAELIARQLQNFNDGPSNIPRITERLRLPAFKYCGHHPYTWPRPQ